MALNLSVVKTPSGVSLSSEQMNLSQGGTVGRGDGNDWVLPDPDRFLSSRHFSISVESGQYFLTDLSTNGTFINGASEPVGKGRKIPLNSGDSIDIGDYQINVNAEGGASAADDPFVGDDPFSSASADDPFGSPPVTNDSEIPGFAGGDPFADPMPITERGDAFQNMSGDTAGFSDIPLDGGASASNADPLAALDNAGYSGEQGYQQSEFNQSNDQGGLGDLLNPSPNPSSAFGTQADNSDPLGQFMDDPIMRDENAPSIPENWWEDDAAPAKPPQSDVLGQRGGHESIPLTDPPRPTGGLLDERRPERVDVFAQQAQKAPPPPKPKPAPAPRQSRPASTGYTSSALLEGMGIADRNLTQEQIDEVHNIVGELMPVIIQGMMQVLRSRASIKNEFRMNITTIQPIENNPLKFSANVDDCIENLFFRSSAAFKAPVESFQEGFDSIGEHQVAIIAGIRAAFKGVMDRFNPDRLEKQFERQNKGVVLPGMQKTKYWNSYADYYNSFVENMENSFQHLFGDDFVQAYEEQLRRLEVERNRK